MHDKFEWLIRIWLENLIKYSFILICENTFITEPFSISDGYLYNALIDKLGYLTMQWTMLRYID